MTSKAEYAEMCRSNDNSVVNMALQMLLIEKFNEFDPYGFAELVNIVRLGRSANLDPDTYGKILDLYDLTPEGLQEKLLNLKDEHDKLLREFEGFKLQFQHVINSFRSINLNQYYY